MDRTIGEIEGRNASSSVKGKKQGLKNSWKTANSTQPQLVPSRILDRISWPFDSPN